MPFLPGLGRTWYERSGSYWARRAAMALLWAFLAALETLVGVAVLIALWHRSPGGFAVLLVIEVAYALGMPAFFLAGTARRWNDPAAPALLGRRSPDRGRAARAGQPRKGFRPLHALGQGLIAPSFLTIGLGLGLLLTSLLPETLAERQARLLVAQELQRRGQI
ncbi:MAG TPA: hypothetical protein VG253_16345 [Streptosporangiaceae bacterium]|nr:hypothetical protein [Streptosporangiaceae bacterium]